MKYEIVKDKYIYSLRNEVNALIAEGWKPQGGVSVAVEPDFRTVYVQAMVKE